MIPVWAKDREGKWQVFPTDMLTSRNGQQVLDHMGSWPLKDWTTWHHLFEWDERNRVWVLKKQVTNE